MEIFIEVNLIFYEIHHFLSIFNFFLTPVLAQEFIPENPIHKIRPVESRSMCSPVETDAYLDSTLFLGYLNWNLQPDSLPMQGKPPKGDTILILYIVSKEGKISSAKPAGNAVNEFVNFVVQKFLHCPLSMVTGL